VKNDTTTTFCYYCFTSTTSSKYTKSS